VENGIWGPISPFSESIDPPNFSFIAANEFFQFDVVFDISSSPNAVDKFFEMDLFKSKPSSWKRRASSSVCVLVDSSSDFGYADFNGDGKVLAKSTKNI